MYFMLYVYVRITFYKYPCVRPATWGTFMGNITNVWQGLHSLVLPVLPQFPLFCWGTIKNNYFLFWYFNQVLLLEMRAISQSSFNLIPYKTYIRHEEIRFLNLIALY